MHVRSLIRFFALIGVAAIAATTSHSAAHAGPAAPATVPPITAPAPILANGWWTCPDTGSCSAPTLHLWLPSFGGGHSIVESGTVTSRCGPDCYEIPNGALITIRALPNAGYRFTGWGGKCQTVHTTGCYFHMWNNYTAGATFDPLPSPSGSSNSSSDPVTTVLDFVVQVSGKGTVVVSGTGTDYPTSVCRPPYPCTMTRYLKRYVQVIAIPTGGGRFLGWGGGRCWGTQTVCTFKDDFDRYNNRPRITATFG